MKSASRKLLLAALVAAGADAQTQSVVDNPADTGATTVYYSVCPTATSTTITLPGTITYCPGPNCNGGGPQITPAPGAGGHASEIIDFTTTGADGKVTVYQAFETVYDAICASSGMCQATYTITEACPCQSARNSLSIPTGFTTTVVACDACGANGAASTVTLTTPCSTGAYATVTPQINPAAGAGAGSGSGLGSGPAALGPTASSGSGSGTGSAASSSPSWASSSAVPSRSASSAAGGVAANAGYPSNSTTVSKPTINSISPAGAQYTGSGFRVTTTLSALLVGVIGCMAWIL